MDGTIDDINEEVAADGRADTAVVIDAILLGNEDADGGSIVFGRGKISLEIDAS
jgi:hypothetical protein